MQRLRAVMTGADGNAFAVEDSRNIMRMHVLHIEGDDAGLVVTAAVTAIQLDIRKYAELRKCVVHQFPFNGFDRIKANVFKIVNRRRKPCCTANILRAGLKLGGKFSKGGILLFNVFDHVAAQEERGHLIEDFILAVKDTDAHGRKHLVTGEGKEIAV